MRFRLIRQRRALETGRIDRFLDLSESLRLEFPHIFKEAVQSSDASVLALASDCHRLIDEMIPTMERALARIQGDAIRTEIERKIREFLAKKEQP